MVVSYCLIVFVLLSYCLRRCVAPVPGLPPRAPFVPPCGGYFFCVGLGVVLRGRGQDGAWRSMGVLRGDPFEPGFVMEYSIGPDVGSEWSVYCSGAPRKRETYL